MKKAISEREIVLSILMEITEQDVYSHIALRNVLEKYQYLEKKERAFITRVTEGTLEHMMELDYILNQVSKVPTTRMKPVIRNLLRSSVYQLKYMDQVPDSAVCNEAVKLAQKKGFASLKGFVNGVLRNVARNLSQISYPMDALERMSIQYSMPMWILELWRKQYPLDEMEQMLIAFQEEKPLTIRYNTRTHSVMECEQALKAEGVTVHPHPYLSYAATIEGFDYLKKLSSFQKGLFSVQDISSMLVGEVAQPKEGDFVLDVCAAPGGKAMHCAELLHGTGQVEARDVTEAKVAWMQENFQRMQLANAKAKVFDARVLDSSMIEKADIVIADLPCSGLGVLGKKADIKYKMTLEQAKELASLQREILQVVSQYVKPGGTLMYSTCTIHAAENEENVAWFLQEHPEFTIGTFPKELQEKLAPSEQGIGMLQLRPGLHQSDGFFLAKLTKGEA
jgi:16S rRNA (cytosine967-C5)-methyltransferase